MNFTLKDIKKGQWILHWHYREYQVAEVTAVNKTVKVTGVYGSHSLLSPEQVRGRFTNELTARATLEGVNDRMARWKEHRIDPAKEELAAVVLLRNKDIKAYIEGEQKREMT